MNIILKENETMQDLVDRLAASFELVYDIAPVAYWYENLYENGRIKDIHFSKRMRDMLGYKSLEEFPDELNTLMTFTHPEDIHAMLDDAIRAGTGEIGKYDVEYRIRRSDGSYMWCNATGLLVKDHNGTTVGMYGSFIDISEKKGLEQAHVEQIEKDALNRALAENSTRILALEDDFEVLYDVELATGHYDIFVKGQTFGEVNNNLINNNSFFDDVEKNLNVVHPDDRQGNFDTTRPEFIRKALSEADHFDRYYRLMVDGQPAWARMRIVYKDAEKKNIIIGVFNAQNDVEAKQIAEQNEKLEEALAFTEFFLEPYYAAYYLGLDDYSWRAYKRPGHLESEYPLEENYVDSLKRFVETEVNPDDRENFAVLLNPAELKKMLAERPQHDFIFKSKAKEGERIFRCSVIRGADENHAAFGFMDVTEDYRRQQERLLGAMPLSNDVLAKANIGMWAFELDEGQPPRMYDDETMLGLVGLDHQVPPEEAYHAWYDHIDEGSYDLVTDAVNKMISGEHAEVQYPWHFPDGRTIIVRCGGVRNYEYTKGIRIEGTHQDVTQTLHFDEEERKRAIQLETDLLMQKLRADSLAFISDNEPDLDNAINFFGKRILEISGCDQVVYRELGGRKIVLNVPGNEEVPERICSECPFSRFDCEAFEKDGTVMMNDCREGYEGIMVPAECPAKSSFMQMVYSGGEIVGKLTVHYLNDYHTFTERGLGLMKTVAVYLGLMIGRIKEKQAQIARIEAESANRAKTEFLFNMSHDIRTPMNAIIGFTDKAIKHKDEPLVFEESLEKVKSSSEYLLRIVNDILDMAKIESGKLELNPELHYGNKGSNSLIEVFGAEAARKGIEFHTDYDVKDKYFWLDENRANQIVANIVSNAIKYTQPGGDIWYRVRQVPCELEGCGRYTVTVEDNGCGMSREFLAKIYDAFERDESAIKSGEQGAGLGMAIVKKLVDAMGASIDIQSEPGKGTKVSFTATHRLATPEEIEAYEATEKDQAMEAVDLEGKKALLVEDNELNREIAMDILEEEGLIVDYADDGTTAVERLKKTGPDYYDFILMDIQMPIMNGYEATREIRKMYPDAKLPIIALSANAFEEDRAASIAAGMDDHVAKPINIKELFGALSKHLK